MVRFPRQPPRRRPPNRAFDIASARAEGEASPAAPYDPDNDVTASEPFDVVDFIRLIHRERDAS